MTAYRVIDDHKELDNVGTTTHAQLDTHVNTTPFIIVSGVAGNIPAAARLLTGSGITITDNGPGGTLLLTSVSTTAPGGLTSQVQFNDGGVFGGDVNFTFNKNTDSLTVTNLSGSLTRLSDGTSYLIAGDNVTIVTGSNGSITINAAAGSGGGSGDPNATYLVLSTTGSLNNERALVASTGLISTDGGPNGNYTLAINDAVVATLSGSTFTGAVNFNAGLSGSLTQLTDGTSYLIAGPGISIVSQSNGSILITGSTQVTPGGLDTYVQFNDGGILGGDSTFTFNKNTDSLTVTNLSGSLTHLSDGTSYLIAGNNITITTGSNGAVTINSTATGGGGGSGDPDATYLVLSTTGSLSNERAFVASTGLLATDGGPNGNYTLSINDSIVATLSGATFTGPVNFNSGLSGSLTQLIDGTSYLIAGSNITIVTGSNGSVTINSTATGGGGSSDPNATYLVLSTTGSLTNERAFVASTGLLATDSGANGNYTLSINDSVVATISGSTFTGPVKFNAGLSGSLTKLTDGTSYLVAGPNILLTTQSNGAVRIEASGGGGGGGSPGGFDTYVQFNDGGNFGGDANFTFNKSTNTLSVDNLSGSLTRLVDGSPYLVAGSNVTISTGSNGSIIINANGGGVTYTSWVEIVSGVADGINTTFTLANTPFPSTSLAFFINGVLQKQGASLDYTLLSNTINTVIPPNSGSNLLATYQYQATAPGSITQWMETPLGATDGINFVFTLQNSPSPSSSLMFFVNGVLQKQGASSDYTISGNTITMNYVPGINSNLSAIYQYYPVALVGSSTSWMEIPTGDVDGVNMVFSISNTPLPTTGLMFFVNGVMQRQDDISIHDYSLSGGTIIMNYAPASGSNIIATYPY